MGLADRDYMRERGRHERRRRELGDLLADVQGPPARKEGSSLLVIVVFWLGIALALYLAFSWLQKRPSPRPAVVERAGVQKPSEPAQARPIPAPVPSPSDEASLRRPAPVGKAAREDSGPASARTPEVQRETQLTAGTIYLCKSYSGGTFWSQAHCGQHQALIDSIVPVPAGLRFEQQVQLAQQRQRELARALHPAPASPAVPGAALGNKTECQALDRKVEELDAMARQPHTGQMQDWIRGERKAARDRQFALRC